MKKFKKHVACVFIICYVSYMIVYIARLNLSMAISALSEHNILTKTQSGLMGTVFFCVFAVGRLLNGVLGDHVRPERFVTAGLVIVSASQLCLGTLPPPWCMTLLWGTNAFGQSMLWGALLKIMKTTYSERDAEKKTSLLVTSTTAGSVAGIVLAMYTIDKLSISFAFYLPGILALVTCVAVRYGIRSPDQIKSSESPGYFPVHLLSNRNMWRILGPTVLHGIIKDNLSLWMAVYFIDRFGIDLSGTTVFIFAIPLTGLLGRLAYMPIFKACSENLYRTTGLAFLLCGGVSLILSVRGIPPVLSAVCLSLLSASIMMVNTSILSIFPMRFAQLDQVSGVSGILDFFTYLGAGIGSFIYGAVIPLCGYEAMYASWAILCIASIILINIAEKRSSLWEK